MEVVIQLALATTYKIAITVNLLSDFLTLFACLKYFTKSATQLILFGLRVLSYNRAPRS